MVVVEITASVLCVWGFVVGLKIIDQARALQRIADALERAHPPPTKKED